MDKIAIVGGGCEEEDAVTCCHSNIGIRALKGFHEEADNRIVVDTDVFFLLVSHLNKISCKQSMMRAGTSKKPKYFPIHTIRERLKKQFLNQKLFSSFMQ